MSPRHRVLVKNGAIVSPDDQTVPDPEAEEAQPAKRRLRGTRAVRSTVMVVLFLFVVFYLVIPRWADQEATARRLRDVNPVLLLTALGLSLGSLVAYSILTKVTLPPKPRLNLFTIFRIQLATKAVTNVVPGGSAAGSTLGYRLFTQAGVPPTSAGFTMATVGIGSAVVLNLVLWVALLISIPLNGFKPAYVSAALIGVLLLAAAAFLVWSLMEGRGRSERVLRAIFRKIPFVKEETAARFVHQLADRLHDLARQPELVRRGVVWAALNWLIDAASLWVFLRAFGTSVDPIALLVAYGVAQVAAAIPITPGGLGVVEGALPTALTGFGVPYEVALAGVLSWRFAQFWLPIPLGGLSYLTLRFGKLGRDYREREEREFGDRKMSVRKAASQRVWDESTGEYRWAKPGLRSPLVDGAPVIDNTGTVAPDDEPTEPAAPAESTEDDEPVGDIDSTGSGDADNSDPDESDSDDDTDGEATA